jgi:hypothetical protein
MTPISQTGIIRVLAGEAIVTLWSNFLLKALAFQEIALYQPSSILQEKHDA